MTMVPVVGRKTDLSWANGGILAAQTVTNAFAGPPLVGLLVGFAGWLVAAFSSMSFPVDRPSGEADSWPFRVAQKDPG